LGGEDFFGSFGKAEVRGFLQGEGLVEEGGEGKVPE